MAINTSSLFGMFALLGNAKAGNGFGVTVSGENAQGAEGGLFSPFSLLMQQTTDENGIVSPGTNNPVTDAKKKLMAANDALQEENKDLSSPDLLLSDLLAVNWQAIQPGDTVNLPNGWTISTDQDGALTLANETLGVALPPFSAQQMQTILSSLTAGDAGFIDPIKPGHDKATPAKDTPSAASSAAASDDAATTETMQDDATTTATQTRLVEAALDKDRISVAKLAALIEVGKPDHNAVAMANAQTETSAAERNKRRTDAAREKNAGASASDAPSSGAAKSGKPDAQAAAANRTNGMATVSADVLLHAAQTFETPSEGDVQIATHSFYNQFGLREVKPSTLMGATPLSPQQMQVVVQKLIKSGETKTLFVQLDPIELGRVQVEITKSENNTIRAHILVEKSEGLAALRADMSALEKALSNAGLQIDGGVTMDLADQGENGKSFTQQAFEELWKERTQDALSAKNAGDDELGTLPASLLINETLVADGRVNIRV